MIPNIAELGLNAWGGREEGCGGMRAKSLNGDSGVTDFEGF